MSTAVCGNTMPRSTAVTAELWISFVALMRSHLAALQVTGKMTRVMLVETSNTSLKIGDLSGNLDLALNPMTGAGNYQLQRCSEVMERGSWTLNQDATATIDKGRALDMELVVESFAQKLSIGPQGETIP